MGQPARLKEQKSSPLELTHPVQIAKPCTRRNAGRTPINDSSTPILTPTVSRAFISTSTPVFVLGPPGRFINKDLQRTTKLALKLFVKGQEHS